MLHPPFRGHLSVTTWGQRSEACVCAGLTSSEDEGDGDYANGTPAPIAQVQQPMGRTPGRLKRHALVEGTCPTSQEASKKATMGTYFSRWLGPWLAETIFLLQHNCNHM